MIHQLVARYEQRVRHLRTSMLARLSLQPCVRELETKAQERRGPVSAITAASILMRIEVNFPTFGLTTRGQPQSESVLELASNWHRFPL